MSVPRLGSVADAASVFIRHVTSQGRTEKRLPADMLDEPVTRVVVLAHGDPYVKNAYISKLAQVMSDLSVPYEFWIWSRDSNYRAPSEVRVVLRGGAWGGGTSAVLGYLRWIALLGFRIKFAPQSVLFFCSRFDTALPCALVSLISRTRFVFLDRDTLSKSYRWPVLVKKVIEKLERFVEARAALHVVPGSSRIVLPRKNQRILRNTPHRDFIRRAKEIAAQSQPRSQHFNVLISGLISPERGAEWMLRVVRNLREYPISFTMAGRLLGTDALELSKLENVRYMGLLTNEEALALTLNADIVWAFYNPSLEINRLAEPNKWFDCATLGVPFVTNTGLLTLAEFEAANACFTCRYGDDSCLESLTLRLASRGELLEEKRQGLARLAFRPWDEGMAEIVREATSPGGLL